MVDLKDLDTPVVLEETLRLLAPGKRTSLVARIEFWKQGSHWCRSLVHRQPFVLSSDLPADAQLIAIYGATVSKSHLGSVLSAKPEQILSLQVPDETSPFRLIEACTGLGGITKGAKAAGFETVAANELRPKFVEVLQSTADFPVIQGNLGKLQTVRDLGQAADKCSAFAMGFNCQPFSAGGDKKAEHDQRALTLPHGLFAAWMIQAPVIVLECVTEAISNSWVRSVLAEFQTLTKFEYSEVCLDLAHIWPSSRRRWWAVLTHGNIGKVPLSELPKLPFEPCIADLLPRPLDLPLAVKASLTLSKQELAQFQQYSKSVEQHILNPNKILPTALHSWGNQTRACACDCRSEGFSHFRLLKRGIYSALVLNEDVSHLETSYRHLSAQETALLCGWARDKGWDYNPRLLLAGVGQLASPIQASWIFSQVRMHLHQIGFRHLEHSSSQKILSTVCFELFDLRDQWFQGESTLAMQMFEEQITSLLNSTSRKPQEHRPARPAEADWTCQDPNCALDLWLKHQNTWDDWSAASKEISKGSVEVSPTVPFEVCEQHSPEKVPSEKTTCQDEFQITGGISGFATKQKRSFEDLSTSNLKPRASYPIQAKGPEKFSVDLSDSSDSSCVPGIRLPSSALSLDFDELGSSSFLSIWVDDLTIHVVKFSAGSTVQEMIAAEASLQGSSFQAFDLLGVKLMESSELTPNQAIVFRSSQPPTTQPDSQVSLPGDVKLQDAEAEVLKWPRVFGLTFQGALVAVDEMSFYLASVAKVVGSSLVHPLQLSTLEFAQPNAQFWMMHICRELEQHMTVVSAILVQGHWHPVHVQWGTDSNGSHLKVTLSHAGIMIWPMLFAPEVRARHVLSMLPLPTVFPQDCGFQSLHWFVAVADQQAFEPVEPQNACAMRYQFLLSKINSGSTPIPLSHLQLGGAADMMQALQLLLKERGVFEERVKARADMLCEKLTKPKVSSALQTSNPWQALKQAANQCSPKIQIVLQDEFDQIRQARVTSGKPVGNKKKPGRRQEMHSEVRLQVSSNDVFLPEGVFKQSDGNLLSQLQIRDISVDASGVVLGSEIELQPFITRPQISTKGLALAVIDPSPKCIQAHGPLLRFPVGCTSTQEPMLINSVLIQKGAIDVVRNRPEQPPQVQEAATQVYKLMLYKDEHNDEWPKVIQAPIRFLFDLMPQLHPCTKADCTCPKPHAIMSEAAEPVLDVWNRDWLNAKFQKVPPREAAIFACHLRTLASAGSVIIKASGFGLYAEQRTSNGKRDDEAAHTVWLTRKALPEAQADLAIAPSGTTLIRVGQRFGLRTALAAAEELHLKLRNDLPFIAGASKSVWQIAPLPWGATRKSVQTLLDQWGWKARPLQPSGRSSDSTGLVWQILSVSPPPHTVYSMQHGDILITEVRPKHAQPSMQLPKIEVGNRTKAFFASQHQTSPDPWQEGQDPWGQYINAQAPKHNTSGLVTASQLTSFGANLEAKIEGKLQGLAQDDPMDTQVQARVSALEQQMQQVLQQQAQQSQQTQALASQVGTLSSHMEDQAKSFEQMVENALDTKLSSHMARLESLITKRQRQEWLKGQGQHFAGWSQKRFPLYAILWIMLSFICRVGEAVQPGPQEVWGLGCLNPNSLLGKSMQIQSLPTGIWCVSESSLSSEGVHRCKAELQSTPQKFRLIPGHPAPLRNPKSSSIGGKQVGVAFLSSFPTRSIDAGWNPEMYASSRLAGARFFVHGQWISGGVCYGYAYRSHTPEVQLATNALLSQLTSQIVHGSSGPRFCAGDWNQPPDVLEEPKIWEQQGFLDLQTWAFQKFGIRPSVTCKGSTRKDFCFISPELQQLLLSVHLDSSLFSDHAVLYGFLKSPGALESRQVWLRPKPFPWNSSLITAVRQEPSAFQPDTQASPTERYMRLGHVFEEHLHSCLVSSNQGGLHQHFRGRASAVALTKQAPPTAPLKPSRYGERMPKFEGINLQYKRFFRQHRRLVNFCRLVKHPEMSTNAYLHKVSLWAAILHSPGFQPSFAQWWRIESSNFAGAPREVPNSAPSHSFARSLCDALACFLDKFETELLRVKVHTARQRRQADVNAIFKDIRAPGPEAVDTLLEQSKAVVTSVEWDNSITFDPPDAFVSDVPLVGAQTVHVTHHIADGQAWLADEHTLQPGQVLVQQQPIGSLQEIHQRFEQEWNQRWNVHAEVTENEWAQRLDTWDPLLPRSDEILQCPPIDACQLQKFIQSRPRKSATGLDGISRSDLLAMPLELRQEICNLFVVAETTGRWPTQMLHGLVFALQKRPSASSVHEHRPITIFSLAYRAWASLRSRSLIGHLSKHAPSSLQGNRKGSSAVGVWWRLQSTLEFFQYQGTPMTGVILDVVKAFNHLPRCPLFRAASYLQVPANVLQAWWGFIHTMIRHFDIRGSLSNGLLSHTGFAEGCGLSVVAMMLYDFILDRWMFARWPSISMVTYVDNISLTTQESAVIGPAVSSLEALICLSDMQLDHGKSLFWSLQAEDRSQLRHEGKQISLATRDLGGHMQFCKKQTNATVAAKLAQLEPMWHRLSRSASTTAQKCRAARQCGWPRAFHSGSITHLGKHLVHHQRSCLMRALRFAGKGVNPWLQLGLCYKPSTDPGYWLLQQSVAHYRKYAAEEVADWILPEAMVRIGKRRILGPHGVLLSRLEDVFWGHSGGSIFVDSLGHRVDLLRICPQEVQLRLTEAWHLKVANELVVRTEFEGLHRVDARLTMKHVASLNPVEQGMMRVVLTGGHVTPHESYADQSECLCSFCGQKDSLAHRHWECPSTEWSRAVIPAELMSQLHELPKCCRLQGWAVLPEQVYELRRLLQSVPDTTGSFEAEPSWWNPQVGIDLFPDGTLTFAPYGETCGMGSCCGPLGQSWGFHSFSGWGGSRHCTNSQ